jgi:hypothetical protein
VIVTWSCDPLCRRIELGMWGSSASRVPTTHEPDNFEFSRQRFDSVELRKLATRMTVLGAIPLSFALPLAAHVASNEIAGVVVATIISLLVAAGIAFIWWWFPWAYPNRLPGRSRTPSGADAAV